MLSLQASVRLGSSSPAAQLPLGPGAGALGGQRGSQLRRALAAAAAAAEAPGLLRPTRAAERLRAPIPLRGAGGGR